jgi:uncharacterized protein (TIGR03435 family)
MRPEEKNSDETLDKALGLFREPPPEMVERVGARVSQRFESVHDFGSEPELALVSQPRKTSWPAIAGIAAAIAAAVLLPTAMLRSAPAIFQDGSGSRTVEYGELIRPEGNRGGTLFLSDGTRVEMRTTAELLLERANDGVKVRLQKGDFIVDAASQTPGQVSVETKDISAVGKVFLVNTEEEGSRVTAIVGEAQVQQGANATKLVPGEQVWTSSKMEPLPVQEAIGWSTQARTWSMILVQASPRDAFEVSSVKPSAGGGRGARGPLQYPCNGPGPRVDPGRFAVDYISVYRLITWAYGKECSVANRAQLISGGPSWMQTEPYAVEGIIPAGTPSYTTQQLLRGAAPKLQKMLQALLAERFKLTVKTEMREMPIYNLVIGKDTGRLKLAEDQTPADPASGSSRGSFSMKTDRASGEVTLSATAVSLQALWDLWLPVLDRPVVNKTDLTGLYDIAQFQFTPQSTNSQIEQILEQLGFKLEATRGPMEVLVIEHVEKPSEN